ncbi:MAG: hypothetical protein WAL29_07450 [Bacteroidales bacterium]
MERGKLFAIKRRIKPGFKSAEIREICGKTGFPVDFGRFTQIPLDDFVESRKTEDGRPKTGE